MDEEVKFSSLLETEPKNQNDKSELISLRRNSSKAQQRNSSKLNRILNLHRWTRGFLAVFQEVLF